VIVPPVPFTKEHSELITRMVKQIPNEYRRQAMGDVVQTLLDGKSHNLYGCYAGACIMPQCPVR
jgi:hypothetical protein